LSKLCDFREHGSTKKREQKCAKLQQRNHPQRKQAHGDFFFQAAVKGNMKMLDANSVDAEIP